MGMNTFLSLLLLLLLLSCCLDGTPLTPRTLGIQDQIKTQDQSIHSIVGGKEITPHSWPFLVQVFGSKKNQGFGVLCGGSILDHFHVLTAAHCVSDTTWKYTVIAGRHDITEKERSVQFRAVERTVVHPRHSKANRSYDVAVLKLKEPLTLSTKVKSIAPNYDSACPTTGSTCKVAGWGRTSFNGMISNVPLQIEVNVWPNDDCSDADIGPEVLCAAGRDVQSPCKGDSGGPLVCECGGTKKLAGVVSRGRRCGGPGLSGNYIRVSYVYRWIRDIICTDTKLILKKLLN